MRGADDAGLAVRPGPSEWQPGGPPPAATRGPDPRVRAAGCTLAVIAAVLIPASRLSAGSADVDALALIGASLVATLLFAGAWLDIVNWRLTGDARSVCMAAAALSLAAVPLVLGVIAPALTETAHLDRARPAVALAGVPALVLLTASACSSVTLTVRRARLVIGVAMVVTAGAAIVLAVAGLRAVALEDGVPLPLAGPATSLSLASAFGAMAALLAAVTHRRAGRLLSWSGLALAGVAVAYVIEVVGGAMVHPSAWLMASAAVAVGLYGASIELQRASVAGQRDARDAAAIASVATSRASVLHAIHQEHRHEARTALLGIEAAAQSLRRHRRLLSADEQNELCSGLVAEIQRLRSLVEDTAHRATSFDLREAIMPVVSCARAGGLTVRADVPAGLDVEGVPESTAQVVLTLLTNARCHAPGSAVELHAEQGEREVALYVEDRGPGIPDRAMDQVFERSARGPRSRGSGLGLFVARRSMARQRGSLDVRGRRGGGSTFVVRLPRSLRPAQAGGAAS